MKKHIKILFYGFLSWLVPFIASIPFVDSEGNFIIDQIFFKTIMIIVGALSGVFLAVRYFKEIKGDYVKEGIIIGVTWFAINIVLDLVMVFSGFFQMAVAKYFTDIGLRYLCLPIYTIGMGYVLKHSKLR
ncbi:MAG: hypothetical protein ABIG39_03245 [Candidatus Micrarchaeota archaeon]